MGLYDDIVNQRVRSLSLREAIVVPPDRPVGEVIRLMREKGLGCAFVVGAASRPLGAFTQGVVTRSLRSRKISMDDSVGDHLDERWACVRLDDPIRSVLDAMVSRRVRFVCVTDDDGRVAALTGQKGLLEYMAEYFPTHVQNIVHRVGAEAIPLKREGA